MKGGRLEVVFKPDDLALIERYCRKSGENRASFLRRVAIAVASYPSGCIIVGKDSFELTKEHMSDLIGNRNAGNNREAGP